MNLPSLVESLSIDLTDSVIPAPASSPLASARATRAELVLRHLVARLHAARAELHALEDQVGPPEELVAWLGTLVATRRQEVEAARLDAGARAEAILVAADNEAAELLATAESEARTLRAVAMFLGAEPLTSAAVVGPPARTSGDDRRGSG